MLILAFTLVEPFNAEMAIWFVAMLYSYTSNAELLNKKYNSGHDACDDEHVTIIGQ